MHGGVPRTASLPHLQAAGSQDASPDTRLGTALGDSTSLPPPAPLPSASGGGDAAGTMISGGGRPLLGSHSMGSTFGRRSGGGRPGSAPLRATALMVHTAPYQRSPEWPGAATDRQQLPISPVSNCGWLRASRSALPRLPECLSSTSGCDASRKWPCMLQPPCNGAVYGATWCFSLPTGRGVVQCRSKQRTSRRALGVGL